MTKILLTLFIGVMSAFASVPQEVAPVFPDLTMTWLGISLLVIFIVGYYFIATEDKYHVDKAKPALFVGTFMFMLIGFYYVLNDLDLNIISYDINHLVFEIAGIFFFLFVAMTYIETLIHMGVFDRLKYNLVSKGYTYRQLYWVTGILAFFLSPIADNLTTALILSTVLITIDNKTKEFLVPGAINIVVAANAGGVWSPFGDITTLMAWTAGKGVFSDFLFLFPSAVLGYLATAYLLSRFVPKTKPDFDVTKEKRPALMTGANVVMGLGIVTIMMAVVSHQVFNLPAMWGMLFGLSLLKLYAVRITKKFKSELNIFHSIAKIENNTLLFFFGILAAVGALYFVGWLNLAVKVYDIIGPTWTNIGVGFLSAIVDNVPVMSAVLKANPDMGLDQWMLVTMTAGIGGSLISFGSAAGVGVMGRLPGIYTFSSHMKYAWTVLIGYFVSLAVWYLQFEVLGLFHIN
ncbi:MAG: sodium:proton antiporter [Arcobacter butzleri]|nr:sodium:proton antiporter [Aliarcobacter butzleri]